MLSDRIHVTLKPKHGEQISQNEFKFYRQYSASTIKTLRKARFQRFIGWLLKKEGIVVEDVANVKVRVFPHKRKGGKWLLGKCTQKGEINIFPKRRGSCLRIIQEFGRYGFFMYLKCRAKATLIHELLHLKYVHDEKMVRKLTRNYFKTYTQNQYPQFVTKMLFP